MCNVVALLSMPRIADPHTMGPVQLNLSAMCRSYCTNSSHEFFYAVKWIKKKERDVP